MADRKSSAILLGAIIGAAAVATTVGVLLCRNRESAPKDVNEMVEQARRTVRKLGEAVDLLRCSA